jgi:putative protein kinase ArgK-like GTPase of G3E family
VKTEATSGAGVDTLWKEIGRFREWATTHRKALQRQRQRQRSHLRDVLAVSFLRHVDGALPSEDFDRFVDAVNDRTRDPYSVVDEIMKRVLPGPRPLNAEPRTPAPGSRLADR